MGRGRRFLVIFEASAYRPSDRAMLLPKAREAIAPLQAFVGDIRIGEKHVELDLFCPMLALNEALKKLTSLFGSPPICVRSLDVALEAPKERVLEEVFYLFNRGRYWESHEALEALWRASEGDEKRALQFLILVSAAFVHRQKGREQVALGILRRALGQAEALPALGNLDLRSLVEQVRGLVEKGTLARPVLKERAPAQLAAFAEVLARL
jgi:predicted metal-dependent hydrolase